MCIPKYLCGLTYSFLWNVERKMRRFCSVESAWCPSLNRTQILPFAHKRVMSWAKLVTTWRTQGIIFRNFQSHNKMLCLVFFPASNYTGESQAFDNLQVLSTVERKILRTNWHAFTNVRKLPAIFMHLKAFPLCRIVERTYCFGRRKGIRQNKCNFLFCPPLDTNSVLELARHVETTLQSELKYANGTQPTHSSLPSDRNNTGGTPDNQILCRSSQKKSHFILLTKTSFSEQATEGTTAHPRRQQRSNPGTEPV